MTESDSHLNDHQRRKLARKEREHSERRAHRDLDATTTAAIDLARTLAPRVAAAKSPQDHDLVIDVELASESEAQFVRKRINDALMIDEWLDDVRVWVWKASEHHREPQSEQGRERGFELRIERTPRD